GKKIGLVYQIIDDILDIESTSEKLGKTIGKDESAGRATFPAVYGLEASREMARILTSEARQTIATLGDKSLKLQVLAEFLLSRKS
ncbi:MAG TPA: polyprenyl synthetase family protein, partial [Candidatus Cloacimonadota bacterium]|nr:polyprenyl synthetase family protein [Candidatus Cloacimonadota bacterium]